MSKIIKLYEHDLLNIVKRVLMEGKNETPGKRVKDAYNLMIDGASGSGTNPKKIVSGIKKLKSKEEFYRLNYLFKDKKTGYKSFNEMITSEFGYIKLFGMSNTEDFKAIQKEFDRLGVEYEDVKNKNDGFKFINLGKGDKKLPGEGESDSDDDEPDSDNDKKNKKFGCIEGDCKNGNGTYKYKSGAVFKGKFLNYKPKKGLFKNADQSNTYNGNFKDGKFVYGTLYDKENSCTWKGNFDVSYFEPPYKNFCPKGYGTETWDNGDLFEGHYSDCTRNGWGKYIDSNGSSFTGEFKDGYPYKGSFKTESGCIYKNGTWDKWEMNGETWSDWADKTCEDGEVIDLSNQDDINNKNNVSCTQPQKPLYKYKNDRMYEYAKSGDCWWAQNVNSKKWFNLTELVKTRPKIQISIDRLNTAEQNNELIMIVGS